MSITIKDLKKHLGPGLGLRKNKYLLEIPMPTVSGETLNILCQSAGLPERNINNVEVWHKGRRYNTRGETDFIGDYEISIVDDSSMQIRQAFDAWLKQIDNTRPNPNASLLGASYEVLDEKINVQGGLIDNIADGVRTANQVRSAIENPRQIGDFILGLFDENRKGSSALYQTDINIWQMSSKGTTDDDNKVYGYKLQNAFPKSLGIVTLEDNEENTISQFSVNFAFSEYIPIKGFADEIVGAVFGDQTRGIFNGVQTLFQ